MHFTLADLVTDIAQNAVEAGADTVELEVTESASGEGREFRSLVRDNGKGMSKETLKRAIDPFVTDGIKHPNRRVGLGLPFMIQTAEQSGGGWDIKSEEGKGTTVTAWFDAANVDTPPEGDISGMFRTIVTSNTQAEIIIRRRRVRNGNNDEYEVRKSELAEALGSLEDAGALIMLDQYLRSLESDEEE